MFAGLKGTQYCVPIFYHNFFLLFRDKIGTQICVPFFHRSWERSRMKKLGGNCVKNLTELSNPSLSSQVGLSGTHFYEELLII